MGIDDRRVLIGAIERMKKKKNSATYIPLLPPVPLLSNIMHTLTVPTQI